MNIKTFDAKDSSGGAYKVKVIPNYQNLQNLDGSIESVALLPEIRLSTGERCNILDKDNGVLLVVSKGIELRAENWVWN